MRLDALFAAMDQRPFRPFSIELMSGRLVLVSHPENIFILPNRQTVHSVLVYQSGFTDLAWIWPEGINALRTNGKKARRKPRARG